MSGYDFRDACEAGDLDKVKGDSEKELAMNLRKDFTITEKAPTRTFYWFEASTCAFTLKALC